MMDVMRGFKSNRCLSRENRTYIAPQIYIIQHYTGRRITTFDRSVIKINFFKVSLLFFFFHALAFFRSTIVYFKFIWLDLNLKLKNAQFNTNITYES